MAAGIRRAAHDQEDHVWRALFERQRPALEGAMCGDFLEGLQRSGLDPSRKPGHRELSKRLERLTGWRIETVPGLIPAADFLAFLRERRFPATDWLRHEDDLTYTPEPDAFHDLFGHVPQLCSPRLAEIAQRVAHVAAAPQPGAALEAERLYWFTIEFGLVREEGALRALGAGLASSIAELQRALHAAEVRRIELDVERARRTAFEFDHQQELYAVASSLDGLLRDLRATREDVDGAHSQ